MDNSHDSNDPVAWVYGDEIFWHDAPDINDHIRATGRPLVYADTSPPPRKPWVGLTDEEVLQLLGLHIDEDDDPDDWASEIADVRVIEAKLKDKNGY